MRWFPVLVFTVIIRVTEIYNGACPAQEPSMSRQPDGSYVRERPTAYHLIACNYRIDHDEEWTNYPEKGGRFIRQVGGLVTTDEPVTITTESENTITEK